MADMGGSKLLSPTPGATVTVTIDTSVRHTLASWTAGEVESVVLSGTPLDNAELVCLITNDATLGRVITFSTGFSANGTVIGVVSKKSTICFRALSGTFYEITRTVGALV